MIFFLKLYKQKGLAWEEASKYVAKQRAKALKAGGAQESKPVAVAPPPGTYVYVHIDVCVCHTHCACVNRCVCVCVSHTLEVGDLYPIGPIPYTLHPVL